jgi:flagellar basal-body rod protein FlgB
MRQSALTGNIANANTPGYLRKDVDFHSALRAAFAQGTDVTTSALENASFTTQTDRSSAMQADGNGVDIDTENAALAKNGLEYEALVTVARARLDILKSAMGVQ